MASRRPGAALLLALLVMLVLECVVIGAVHVTLLERRLADNGISALRLRLAAESMTTAAAATWPAALDTITIGSLLPEISSTHDGLGTRVVYQRIDSALVLIFAEVSQPPPHFGRARAARLIEPPLVPAERIPAAALTAGGAVRVRSSAQLSATPVMPCADDSIGSADALRVALPTLLSVDASAAVDGTIGAAAPSPDHAALIKRVAALADPVVPPATAGGPVGITSRSTGVIAVTGDAVIAAGAVVTGLVLITGSLIIDLDATVDGVIIVMGDAEIAGTVRLSRCAALAAARSAGLHLPVPHSIRSAVPAF